MKRLKFQPRAIFFDMDGVIVDSMPYHFIAWYEALRPWGVRINSFDVYQREGERWDKTLLDFLKTAHIQPSRRMLKKIFAARQKIFQKYFKRYIFPGVPEFLACLKKKDYLLALVTGTPEIEVRQILPRKICKFFDVLVTGDQVQYGKPHPAPYLEAAKLLKLKPRECLVVENGLLGITSAKRAGMFCIALTTSLPAQFLKKADLVVDRLEEITKFIDHSCRI